jgi:hypothetical protein
MPAIHRQDSRTRHDAAKYRRKHARWLKHHRKHRLTQKEKASVRKRVVAGFYKKIAKLREDLSLPATATGTLRHPQRYIELVLEWSSNMPDPAVFVSAFLKRPGSTTTTDAGMCAIQLEAWMIENSDELYAKFVEAVVEPEEPSFFIVFEGKLTPDDKNKLSMDPSSFVEIEFVLEAGTIDADGNVSDVSIAVCTPLGEQQSPDPETDEPGADEKPADQHTKIPEHSTTGPVSLTTEELASRYRVDPIAESWIDQDGNILWQDPKGHLFTLAGDRWESPEATLPEAPKPTLTETEATEAFISPCGRYGIATFADSYAITLIDPNTRDSVTVEMEGSPKDLHDGIAAVRAEYGTEEAGDDAVVDFISDWLLDSPGDIKEAITADGTTANGIPVNGTAAITSLCEARATHAAATLLSLTEFPAPTFQPSGPDSPGATDAASGAQHQNGGKAGDAINGPRASRPITKANPAPTGPDGKPVRESGYAESQGFFHPLTSTELNSALKPYTTAGKAELPTLRELIVTEEMGEESWFLHHDAKRMVVVSPDGDRYAVVHRNGTTEMIDASGAVAKVPGPVHAVVHKRSLQKHSTTEAEAGTKYFIVWRKNRGPWSLRDGKALTARASSAALVDVEADEDHDYAVVSAASKEDAKMALTSNDPHKGFVDLPVRAGDPGYDQMEVIDLGTNTVSVERGKVLEADALVHYRLTHVPGSSVIGIEDMTIEEAAVRPSDSTAVKHLTKAAKGAEADAEKYPQHKESYSHDAADLHYVAAQVKRGDHAYAHRTLSRLDSAVRDRVPAHVHAYLRTKAGVKEATTEVVDEAFHVVAKLRHPGDTPMPISVHDSAEEAKAHAEKLKGSIHKNHRLKISAQICPECGEGNEHTSGCGMGKKSARRATTEALEAAAAELLGEAGTKPSAEQYRRLISGLRPHLGKDGKQVNYHKTVAKLKAHAAKNGVILGDFKHEDLDEGTLEKMKQRNAASNARSVGYHATYAAHHTEKGNEERADDHAETVASETKKYVGNAGKWTDVTKHPAHAEGVELAKKHIASGRSDESTTEGEDGPWMTPKNALFSPKDHAMLARHYMAKHKEKPNAEHLALAKAHAKKAGSSFKLDEARDGEDSHHNEGYGYHGEMHTAFDHHTGSEANQHAHTEWKRMHAHIVKHAGVNGDTVRKYLNSRAGRHLGDQVRQVAGKDIKPEHITAAHRTAALAANHPKKDLKAQVIKHGSYDESLVPGILRDLSELSERMLATTDELALDLDAFLQDDPAVAEGEEELPEVAPPGWSGTVKAMKHHKEISNPFALAWAMKKRGAKPHYKPERKVGEDVTQLIFAAMEDVGMEPDVRTAHYVMKLVEFTSSGTVGGFRASTPIGFSEPPTKGRPKQLILTPKAEDQEEAIYVHEEAAELGDAEKDYKVGDKVHVNGKELHVHHVDHLEHLPNLKKHIKRIMHVGPKEGADRSVYTRQNGSHYVTTVHKSGKLKSTEVKTLETTSLTITAGAEVLDKALGAIERYDESVIEELPTWKPGTIDEVADSHHPEGGFHGTLVQQGRKPEEAKELFRHAHKALMKDHNVHSKVARNYLDSTYGRHTADELQGVEHEEAKAHVGHAIKAVHKSGEHLNKALAQVKQHTTDGWYEHMADGVVASLRENSEADDFNLDDVQTYYDMMIVQDMDEDDAIEKTKEKFKLDDLSVSPTGKVAAPGVGEPIKLQNGQPQAMGGSTTPGAPVNARFSTPPPQASGGQPHEAVDPEDEDTQRQIDALPDTEAPGLSRLQRRAAAFDTYEPSDESIAEALDALDSLNEDADDAEVEAKADEAARLLALRCATTQEDPRVVLKAAVEAVREKYPSDYAAAEDTARLFKKAESIIEKALAKMKGTRTIGPASSDSKDKSPRMGYMFGEATTDESRMVADLMLHEKKAEGSLTDKDLRSYFVPGKSFVIDDVWWTIKARDLDKDTATIAKSTYAMADGHEAEVRKVKYSDILKNINSGKWGGSTPDKGHIGAKQDKEVRAKFRAKNGKRASPGTATKD